MVHGKMLLAGDFNAVVDKPRDRLAGCAKAPLELQSFIHEENLHDIWRYQHANECDYTYYSPPKFT